MKNLIQSILAILLAFSIYVSPAQVVAPKEDKKTEQREEEKRSETTIFMALVSLLFGAGYVTMQETKDELPPPSQAGAPPSAPPSAPASEERQGGGSRRFTFQGVIVAQEWAGDGCSYGFGSTDDYSATVVIVAEIDEAGNIANPKGFIEIVPTTNLLVNDVRCRDVLNGSEKINPDAELTKHFALTRQYIGPITLADGRSIYPRQNP